MAGHYTSIDDFMPYAMATARALIGSGNYQGIQQFVRDLINLSENIESLCSEIPGQWERYKQTKREKELVDEQMRALAEKRAALEQGMFETFGVLGDTAAEPIISNPPTDNMFEDSGFDFDIPLDDSQDDAQDDYDELDDDIFPDDYDNDADYGYEPTQPQPEIASLGTPRDMAVDEPDDFNPFAAYETDTEETSSEGYVGEEDNDLADYDWDDDELLEEPDDAANSADKVIAEDENRDDDEEDEDDMLSSLIGDDFFD